MIVPPGDALWVRKADAPELKPFQVQDAIANVKDDGLLVFSKGSINVPAIRAKFGIPRGHLDQLILSLDVELAPGVQLVAESEPFALFSNTAAANRYMAHLAGERPGSGTTSPRSSSANASLKNGTRGRGRSGSGSISNPKRASVGVVPMGGVLPKSGPGTSSGGSSRRHSPESATPSSTITAMDLAPGGGSSDGLGAGSDPRLNNSRDHVPMSMGGPSNKPLVGPGMAAGSLLGMGELPAPVPPHTLSVVLDTMLSAAQGDVNAVDWQLWTGDLARFASEDALVQELSAKYCAGTGRFGVRLSMHSARASGWFTVSSILAKVLTNPIHPLVPLSGGRIQIVTLPTLVRDPALTNNAIHTSSELDSLTSGWNPNQMSALPSSMFPPHPEPELAPSLVSSLRDMSLGVPPGASAPIPLSLSIVDISPGSAELSPDGGSLQDWPMDVTACHVSADVMGSSETIKTVTLVFGSARIVLGSDASSSFSVRRGMLNCVAVLSQATVVEQAYMFSVPLLTQLNLASLRGETPLAADIPFFIEARLSDGTVVISSSASRFAVYGRLRDSSPAPFPIKRNRGSSSSDDSDDEYFSRPRSRRSSKSSAHSPVQWSNSASNNTARHSWNGSSSTSSPKLSEYSFTAPDVCSQPVLLAHIRWLLAHKDADGVVSLIESLDVDTLSPAALADAMVLCMDNGAPRTALLLLAKLPPQKTWFAATTPGTETATSLLDLAATEPSYLVGLVLVTMSRRAFPDNLAAILSDLLTTCMFFGRIVSARVVLGVTRQVFGSTAALDIARAMAAAPHALASAYLWLSIHDPTGVGASHAALLAYLSRVRDSCLSTTPDPASWMMDKTDLPLPLTDSAPSLASSFVDESDIGDAVDGSVDGSVDDSTDIDNPRSASSSTSSSSTDDPDDPDAATANAGELASPLRKTLTRRRASSILDEVLLENLRRKSVDSGVLRLGIRAAGVSETHLSINKVSKSGGKLGSNNNGKSKDGQKKERHSLGLDAWYPERWSWSTDRGSPDPHTASPAAVHVRPLRETSRLHVANGGDGGGGDASSELDDSTTNPILGWTNFWAIGFWIKNRSQWLLWSSVTFAMLFAIVAVFLLGIITGGVIQDRESPLSKGPPTAAFEAFVLATPGPMTAMPKPPEHTPANGVLVSATVARIKARGYVRCGSASETQDNSLGEIHRGHPWDVVEGGKRFCAGLAALVLGNASAVVHVTHTDPDPDLLVGWTSSIPYVPAIVGSSDPLFVDTYSTLTLCCNSTMIPCMTDVTARVSATAAERLCVPEPYKGAFERQPWAGDVSTVVSVPTLGMGLEEMVKFFNSGRGHGLGCDVVFGPLSSFAHVLGEAELLYSSGETIPIESALFVGGEFTFDQAVLLSGAPYDIIDTYGVFNVFPSDARWTAVLKGAVSVLMAADEGTALDLAVHYGLDEMSSNTTRLVEQLGSLSTMWKSVFGDATWDLITQQSLNTLWSQGGGLGTPHAHTLPTATDMCGPAAATIAVPVSDGGTPMLHAAAKSISRKTLNRRNLRLSIAAAVLALLVCISLALAVKAYMSKSSVQTENHNLILSTQLSDLEADP